MNASELIKTLGGTREVAAAIGRPVGTVASWRHRNAIPVEDWPLFISLAGQRGLDGISADAMLAMHAEWPADPAPTPAAESAA